jgi:hypothetical protein
MSTSAHARIQQAQALLSHLGFSGPQTNELAALTLLALIDLAPDKAWADASSRIIGITPMMKWITTHYGRQIAPNTRETVRKVVMHHLVEQGVALYNPDNPSRAVNSPKAAYQTSDHALHLIRAYTSHTWDSALTSYAAGHMQAAATLAQTREAARIPMTTPDGGSITLSPGAHSALIHDVVELFRPMFTPGADLLYVGDTGRKWAYYDGDAFEQLQLTLDPHGKMPDVILWWRERGWLLLVEAVTSHGPIDAKRHAELTRLFTTHQAALIHVTALPTRAALAPLITSLAWETEVWLADEPEHLIHLNGDRFLGPHK